MHELDLCKKRTLLKPEGIRRVGKPRFRWLASAEEDTRTQCKELEMQAAELRAVEGNFGRG
jgi:hypothetical protein